MLKSIFNYILSPFFTTFSQKWHLNRKNTYFSLVLYCIEFPNSFPNFHYFHTYIVYARYYYVNIKRLVFLSIFCLIIGNS